MRIRVNRFIRVPEVRVIDSEGNQLGVMPTPQAMHLAEEAGLDLVEISPTSRPPVCRIMDFGKYKYELNKRLKQSKKKQHVIQVKEIKLRPKTEEHDYQFKKRHAEEFLQKNHKVKFTLIFRGREMSHKEMGDKMLRRMAEDLSHIGTVEKGISFEGRFMIMIMNPGATKQAGKEQAGNPESKAEPKTEPKTEPKVEPKAEPETEPKTETGESAKEGNDAQAKIE
jgi:translation initiation factor IF-3